MKKKKNQNKTIKSIIIKKTPGHISYSLLNAVGHTHTLPRGSTEPRKRRSEWRLWRHYTAIRRRLTFTFIFFVYFFCLEMREEEQRRRLRLSGRRRARRSGWTTGVGVGGTTGENTEARSSPEAEGEGTTLLLFFLFSFRWIIFFLPIPLHFTTDSRISLAKNPEVEGSSRWCTACPGRTWGTCNPEADLERMEHSFQWSVYVKIRGKEERERKKKITTFVRIWGPTWELPYKVWLRRRGEVRTVCSEHQLRPENVGLACVGY